MDEFDEPPIGLGDVVNEVSNLGDRLDGSISGLPDRLDEIEQKLGHISHVLEVIGDLIKSVEVNVLVLIFVTIVGFAAVLGTLRHWF